MMDMSKLTNQQLEIASRVADEAVKQGIDPDFAVAVANAESGLRIPTKPSSAGALGVMQLMPETVSLYNKKHKMDINPNDLDSNISGGVFILKDMLNTYKTPQNAVIAYNTSVETRDKFFSLYKTDPDAAMKMLPQETIDYGTKVGENYKFDVVEPNKFVPVAEQLMEEEISNPRPKDEEAVYQSHLVSDVTTAAGAGAVKGLAEKAILNPSLPSSKESLLADERLARAKAQEGIIRGRMGLDESKVSHFIDNPLESQFASQLPEAERQAAAAEEALRASGSKVQGASGASNWMRSMAGAQHQLPENILASATDMTKASPTGGQRLIDEDVLNLKKIKGMGAGNYSLVGEGAGQLMLPPSVATERGATLAEQAKAAQAPLYNEVKTTTSRLATAREGAANAAALAKAKERTALAQDTANRALKEHPPTGTLKNFGLKVAKSPVLWNALSGAGTALSAEEALYRYNHGDKSGFVLNALATLFGGMSMIPPVHPWAIAGKGIGAAGGLGLIPFQMAYDYYNPRQPEKKARGGLVRNSR